MRDNLCFSLVIVFFVTQCICIAEINAAPKFTDNKLSATKLSYCERLTKRLGRRSWETNSSWSQFDRMSEPDSSKWRLWEIVEPGWFVETLKIWYEAPEPSNPYHRHGALCKWEENGDFEFLIDAWDYGYVVECALSDYSGYPACP